jgi:hypothetical protein
VTANPDLSPTASTGVRAALHLRPPLASELTVHDANELASRRFAISTWHAVTIPALGAAHAPCRVAYPRSHDERAKRNQPAAPGRPPLLSSTGAIDCPDSHAPLRLDADSRRRVPRAWAGGAPCLRPTMPPSASRVPLQPSMNIRGRVWGGASPRARHPARRRPKSVRSLPRSRQGDRWPVGAPARVRGTRRGVVPKASRA